MSDIIKFFTSDLGSLLFLKEKHEQRSGYARQLPRTADEAWRRDMENIGKDMRKAMGTIEMKVAHGQEVKA